MLTIIVPGLECYNEETEEFYYYPDVNLDLEHSLVAISKWESKWHKPFLNGADRTLEEIVDYIKCMAVNDVEDVSAFDRLTEDNLISINNYIGESMTATTFNDEPKAGGREIITSEIIYYWMVTYNIPFECQYWHLNRLLTLIKVCNAKNNPPKKMSQREILARNKALNESRKKQLNTRG